MSTTAKLYRLFTVERQLRGLKSRLTQAERFHNAQTHELANIEKNLDAVNGQIRQLKAAAADHEGEAKRLEERIEQIRAQMNEAKTNKEYKAFLTEVNTFTADKTASETAALEQMEKIDTLEAKKTELEAAKAERQKMQKVAEQQKAERAEEIKDRVAELEEEYVKRKAEVPADGLAAYNELVDMDPEEDPMAGIEIQNKRRHEYTCGSCMVIVPMETVSGLLSHGGLTRCPSCQVILYLEEDVAKQLQPT